MTVRELTTKMDASELMEWVAFFQLEDEDVATRYKNEVELEKPMEERAVGIRQFLSTIRPNKSPPIITRPLKTKKN